jgi:hypothetical protein
MGGLPTNLHFVHDGGHDDKTTLLISERVLAMRNWHPMLLMVHMSINDVVFTAD